MNGRISPLSYKNSASRPWISGLAIWAQFQVNK